MTSVSVQILHGTIQYNLNPNLINEINIFRKVSEGISRFNCSVRNNTGMYNGSMAAEDTVQIQIDGIDYLYGYLDSASPTSKSDKDIYQQELYLSGRDHAQDMMNIRINKMITSSEPGIKDTYPAYPQDIYPYSGCYADDVIDSMLMNGPTNIGFSPNTVDHTYNGVTIPIIGYGDSGGEYIIEGIRKILEQTNFDGYVDNNRDLQIFPVGTIDSSIVLQTGSNILKLEPLEFDSTELRNYITVYGPEVTDGWSEYNATIDFTCNTGCTLSDEHVEVQKGAYSIKCVKAPEVHSMTISLDFPHFNYDYLPYDQYYNKKISLWFKGSLTIDEVIGVKMRLADTNDHTIDCFTAVSGQTPAEWSLWHQVVFPVGLGAPYEIRSIVGWEQNDIWYKRTPGAWTFNWQVKRIELAFSPIVDIAYIDGIAFEGVQMVAYASDEESQDKYKLRDMFINAKNIVTQAELQDVADSNLSKFKDPTRGLNITCLGSAGVIGGENRWIPGYKIFVDSPNDNISEYYRMIDIHIKVSDEPIMSGQNFIAEISCVPVAQEVSSRRLAFSKDKNLAIVRAHNDAIRNLDKVSEEKIDIVPRLPRPVYNETTGEFDYPFVPADAGWSYDDGTFHFGTLIPVIDIPTANIGSLDVTVAIIGSVGSIDVVNCGVLNAGEIGSVGVITAGVANITTLNSVAVFTAGIVNASVLGSIGTATIGILTANTIIGVGSLDVGILVADSIGSIGTATITNLWTNSISINTLSLTNLFAQNASIGVISSTLTNLNAITANIGTIAGVQNLNVISASISTITNVNNLVALNVTVNGTVTAAAGTIINMYGTSITFTTGTINNFLAGTISGNSIKFNIGTINNFLAGTISGNSINFNIGTINNFQAGTIGGNSIKFNIGTINNFQVGTISGNSVNFNIGSVTTFLINSATIAKIDINAGTIDNVLFQNSTINFANITNTGNLVIGSSSISTLSLLSIASNNVIQNNNINTFTITYDRLVIPPLGWNLIVNPGFEYGRWQASGGFGAPSTIDSHSGRYCHYIATSSSIVGSEIHPNWINLKGESSFVVSIWLKGSINGSGAFARLWFDKASDQYGTGYQFMDYIGVDGATVIPNWKQYSGTFALDPAKPFIRPELYFGDKGTMKFDDCSITRGNQLTSFVDTTVAKDRWMPDFYYSKEVNTIQVSGEGVLSTTLSCTIDYKARAIIYAGAWINNQMTTISGSTIYFPGYRFRVKVNNTPVGSFSIIDKIYCIGVQNRSDESFLCEEGTLNVGANTIIMEVENLLSGNTLAVYSRYIRVIAGSYFG